MFHLVKTCNLHFGKSYSKEGSVFLVVILSEFHMGQYRDDKHREDGPHLSKIFLDGSEITITIDQKVRLMVEVIFKVLALYLFLFAVRLLIPTFNQFLIYFILVLLESIDYRFINLRKVLFWNKYENCTFTFHLPTTSFRPWDGIISFISLETVPDITVYFVLIISGQQILSLEQY